MSTVKKVIIFFEDGSFVEYDAMRPSVSPAMPNIPLTPSPFNPADPYFKASNCPKCGLELKGVMGYVCNQYPCPAGLGGVWSTCGND